jgi:MoxR-like ATPase
MGGYVWNIGRSRAERRDERCDVRVATAASTTQGFFRISSSNGNRMGGYRFRSHVAEAFDAILRDLRIEVRWCFNDVLQDLSPPPLSPEDAAKFRPNRIDIQRRRGAVIIANHAVYAELRLNDVPLERIRQQVEAALGPALRKREGQWSTECRSEQDLPKDFLAQFSELHSLAAERDSVIKPRERIPVQDPQTYELQPLVELSRNLILEGVPGTGKSHEITRLAGSGFAEPITTIVMHPAIGYEDMIEGVRPTAGGLESGANLNPKLGVKWFYECYGEDANRTQLRPESPFGVRGGQFLLACARACKQPDDDFLIVLDEINRCNVPRAFGELLLSIEASKRWRWNDQSRKWEGDSPSVTLPYSGLQFFVPDNLYILGTMNTSDRSVAPLDQALRRRFAFHRLEPLSPSDLKGALAEFGASSLVSNAIDCWHSLNTRLEAELGADMMLGHSYFFDAKRMMEQGSGHLEALRSTWRYSLLPQLFEILHIANRIELARADDLTRHLSELGLEIEFPRATGMHAMLRVKERPSANGGT